MSVPAQRIAHRDDAYVLRESVAALRPLSHPLNEIADLDPLLDRIGDARYVLLGEASHGTSEYYTWRARLSQRLIDEKGFSFIAVEGDWPDCYCINRYVKGYRECGDTARAVLQGFERWPAWMWANWEVVALAEWLRRYNDSRPEAEQAGFYGLDMYSLWESLEGVLHYLERIDPDAAFTARRAYRCFEPFSEDSQQYARAARLGPTSCEADVVKLLTELRENAPVYRSSGRDDYFNAEQNALVVKSAETYYRTMAGNGPESWNVRDRHMAQTLERLMQHHGPEAKAIVWEHNTHIGDARFTDMARGGMVNLGQLVRESHPADDVVLVGFAGHRGSVIAGSSWGAPMERMPVPAAKQGSWEDALHQDGADDRIVIFERDTRDGPLLEPRGHRAIGVVYEPLWESFGNYVPTVLPRRYDALIYLEETTALHPLHLQPRAAHEPPETYPWGV